MELNYIYKGEIGQFDYSSIPKALFEDEKFAGLTVDAKILYGLLLDKMSESSKNNWIDEDGCVYIIYPVEDMLVDLNLSKRKTIDTLSELDEIGLIDRRRQGRGNPNMIYVKNFNRPLS